MELIYLGALAAVMLTPLSVRLAIAVGAVDMPDGVRKCHALPTPRLGGIAAFFAVFAVALMTLPPTPTRGVWLAGGALLCVLGVSDDIFSLPPHVKLVAQCAVATIPIAFGLVPAYLTVGSFSVALPRVLANLLAVLWVVLLSNAFNLIDGMDGLCVTQTMLSAVFLAWLADRAALLLFGAAFGFLPYNRPSSLLFRQRVKTRSFLGDTGALFMGYSLAVLSLDGEGFSVFLPLLFFIPLADAVVSFFRRIRQGKDPFQADAEHLHHLLMRRTGSAVASVALLALASFAGASLYALLTFVTAF